MTFIPDPKPEKKQKVLSPFHQKRQALPLKKKRNAEKTLSALIDLFDTVFSIVRRKMAADEYGRVQCCTCEQFFYWKRVDCGHFVNRADYVVRWDTRNTAPQCRGLECNGHVNGNKVKFAAYIDKTWGAGTAEELEALSKQPFKLDRGWLVEQIGIYKKKLTQLNYIP